MENFAPLAVSTSEAFRAIGVGRSLGYELIATGQLRIVKIGRRTLVPVESLRAFIDAKVKEAA